MESLETKVDKQEEFKKRIAWTAGLIVGALLLAEQFGKIYTSFFS